MRANPDCVRATLDDCGRTALDALTFTAGLRVSPCLAAAGFQEMRPAFTLVFASKGDAITGINRADSASVDLSSILCDLARNGNSIVCVAVDLALWSSDLASGV